MEAIKIKESLSKVWNAFFLRHGKLLPTQQRAIPIVLEGKNLILISPAATGKTEAICAPVAERMLKEGWKPPSFLYISPTRALVNDIYRRLSPAFSSLGLKVGRKTAEYEILKNPPHVLITTPEGLDSLLCRRPSWLRNVEAICLDEVHLYEGSARADALALSLHRVFLIKGTTPSLYALSATYAEPFSIAEKYLFSNAETIISKKKTFIDYTLIDFSDKELLGLLWALNGAKKILFFCNTRAEAEEMAISLKRELHKGERIFVHHASISKREREMIEELIHRERAIFVVSTLTLELGIDIWDVDAIVFLSPPPSCASLLQRLGRGIRGKDRIRAFGLYRNEFEKVMFECMFELAKIGWVEGSSKGKRLSAVVQQILSYILQKRRIGATMQSIERMLSPFGLDASLQRALILHLHKKGYIKEEEKDVFFPTSKLLHLFNVGRVHSNIERVREDYEVLEASSLKSIGNVQSPKPTFTLGGRIWKVLKIEGKKLFVKDCGLFITEEKSLKKVFKGKGRALWDRRLGRMLRCSLFGMKAKDALPYIKEGDYLYVFHFFGVIWGYIWAESLLERAHIVDVDGVYLQCSGVDVEELVNVSKEALYEVVEKSYKVLSKFLNMGSWFWSLPSSLQITASFEAAEVEELYKSLKSARFYALTP